VHLVSRSLCRKASQPDKACLPPSQRHPDQETTTTHVNDRGQVHTDAPVVQLPVEQPRPAHGVPQRAPVAVLHHDDVVGGGVARVLAGVQAAVAGACAGDGAAADGACGVCGLVGWGWLSEERGWLLALIAGQCSEMPSHTGIPADAHQHASKSRPVRGRHAQRTWASLHHVSQAGVHLHDVGVLQRRQHRHLHGIRHGLAVAGARVHDLDRRGALVPAAPQHLPVPTLAEHLVADEEVVRDKRQLDAPALPPRDLLLQQLQHRLGAQPAAADLAQAAAGRGQRGDDVVDRRRLGEVVVRLGRLHLTDEGRGAGAVGGVVALRHRRRVEGAAAVAVAVLDHAPERVHLRHQLVVEGEGRAVHEAEQGLLDIAEVAGGVLGEVERAERHLVDQQRDDHNRRHRLGGVGEDVARGGAGVLHVDGAVPDEAGLLGGDLGVEKGSGSCEHQV